MRLTAIVPATDGPPTLVRCLDAIAGADEPPEEVIVERDVSCRTPADARNRAAARASGDALVFVDADVLVHPDAFARIRRAFADEGVDAVFGSYDERPEHRGFVSRFRNLLHHHVHQHSSGGVATFWTGLGAVRTDVFRRHGGFDPRRRWLEDVELGLRLARAGSAIVLDAGLLGTHLKGWSLREMVRTDLARRGMPWVELLIAHRRLPADLNLRWQNRASALLVVGSAGALTAGAPILSVSGLATVAGLNASFYALLARRGGPLFAAGGVALHLLHLLLAAASVPAGMVSFRGR